MFTLDVGEKTYLNFNRYWFTVTIYDCFLILSVYGVIDKCCVGGVVKWVGVRPTNQSHRWIILHHLLDAVICIIEKRFEQ